MKRLRIILVVFLAVIVLGIKTGLVTLQAYRLPEQNYLAMGTVFTQNQNSAVVNPLDSKTIAKIENGSLTLEEIQEVKETIQTSINKGFEKWVMRQPGGLFRMYMADNETVKSMFFSFLGENPEYRKLFKLYDLALTGENDYLMQEIYP